MLGKISELTFTTSRLIFTKFKNPNTMMEETHKLNLTIGQKIERLRTFRGFKQE